MNFEVGEKQAKVAARARVHESARGCGARMRSLAARDPGLARQVERLRGSRHSPGREGRVPATQLRRGFSPLLLLNLLAQSSLRCSPAPLPANFPGQSDKPGGVEGSGEVKEA